jgi:hypothetical protein
MAVTRGTARLSSMSQEEKSSVRAAMAAQMIAVEKLKEKARNIQKEKKKKVSVPSRDLPIKRTLPNLLPIIDASGSEIERTKREATAIYFSKNAIVISPART